MMQVRAFVSSKRFEMALVIGLCVAAFVLRIWGIQDRFWLLEDQIRDWGYVLGSFRDLPLVGSPTHVHGYAIGPAFYWILWVIRVVLGPFFDNLPHAGGIGQAALQTAADGLLMVAVWRRTRSPWIALTMFVMVVTSGFELSIAALVWNPTMGSTLAKAAMALVLLDWHRGSALKLVVIAAVAWCAVHAYTGAIFLTLVIFLAIVIDTFRVSGRPAAIRALAAIVAVVAVLQVPLLVYQIRQGFREPAMSAVSGGIADVLTGRTPLQWRESVAGYLHAVELTELIPRKFPEIGWVLLAGAAITGWRFRRNTTLLIVVLLPQLGALAGFCFFVGNRDPYYYLSLMPAAVLTVILPLTAIPWPRVAHAAGALALVAALAAIPAKVEFSNVFVRLPEYKVLVSASRTLVHARRTFRAIRTDFTLPPTCDPDFLYRVLGGRMDRSSPWVAIIAADGRISYINNDLKR